MKNTFHTNALLVLSYAALQWPFVGNIRDGSHVLCVGGSPELLLRNTVT